MPVLWAATRWSSRPTRVTDASGTIRNHRPVTSCIRVTWVSLPRPFSRPESIRSHGGLRRSADDYFDHSKSLVSGANEPSLNGLMSVLTEVLTRWVFFLLLSVAGGKHCRWFAADSADSTLSPHRYTCSKHATLADKNQLPHKAKWMNPKCGHAHIVSDISEQLEHLSFT